MSEGPALRFLTWLTCPLAPAAPPRTAPGRLASTREGRVLHVQKCCELTALPAMITNKLLKFRSVQSISRVRLCNPMNRSTPGLPVHHHLPSSLRLTSIESVMPSSHLILCHPLLLLPPIPPSIRVFSNESTLHMRWPKYWSFSFNISPSKEMPGLISIRMDWLDLLAVQGTLKSLLQHHSSKHQFFGAQLSS